MTSPGKLPVAGLVMLICGLVVAAFHGALQADFVAWDDSINVYRNPHIQGLTAENLTWMFADTEQALRYKPLSWLSWTLIHEAVGLKPFGYHLVNLCFHAANAVLLFLIVARMLARVLPEQPAGVREIAAAIGAVIWAVHPLRVEPVVWVTGLPYVQSLFFVLLALLLYLHAHPAEGGRRPLPYWGAAVAYLLAVLTYPVVLGFVPVLVLVDWFVLKQLPLAPKEWLGAGARKVWLEKVPFAVAASLLVAAALYARFIGVGNWAAPASISQFGPLERLAQAGYVWAYYLWKPFAPLDLCPVYTQLLDFSAWDLPFIGSAVLLVVVTVILFGQRRRWPCAGALWLAHLALLVPVLGLTEHPHYPSDRYGYVGAIVWAPAIAGGLVMLWQMVRWRGIAIGATAIVVVACGGMTVRQAALWKNTDTLFADMLVKLDGHSHSSTIYFILGVQRLEEGRPAEAEIYLRQALLYTPRDARLLENLGDALANQKRLEPAIAMYRQALKVDPEHFKTHNNLGIALGQSGKLREAEAEFEAYLRAAPNDSIAHRNLAITLHQLGETNRASFHMEKSKSLAPR